MHECDTQVVSYHQYQKHRICISALKRRPGRQLFISLEHEKSAYGVFSPGPCTASVEAAASSKRLSTQRQPSAWGFGTSRRLPVQRNDAPGPGEYYA